MKLNIVLLAYEEYENLRILIPEIKKYTRTDDFDIKIIVVGKNEGDRNTSELCKQLDTTFIHRAPGNTFGDALRSGLKYSEDSDWVIVMDADGSHNPKYLPTFIDKISENTSDLIIGSRYVKGGATDNPFVLILLSKILNLVYSIYLKLDIKDVSNNFRAYKTKQISSIELVEENFEIVEEILVKLIHNVQNLSVYEIPIRFEKRMLGDSKRKFIIFVFTLTSTLLKLKKYKK